MAQNDIIVPREGANNVLTEIVLPDATTSARGLLSATDKTKLNGIAEGAEVNVNADWNASSGDAQILNKPASFTPSAHASTHHTGGTDAIAPNQISAAYAEVLSTQTISANTLLSAGRNRRITLFAVGATADVDLPHQNNQAGDVVTLVADFIVASTLSIRRASVMSGSTPVAYSTLATLNASGQSFTFVSNGTATDWSLRAVDSHDASRVTSGTFDNARINFAAPPAIGSTTPAAGSFTTLTAQGDGTNALVAQFGQETNVNHRIDIWGNGAGRNHGISASTSTGLVFQLAAGAQTAGIVTSATNGGFRVYSTGVYSWGNGGNAFAGSVDLLLRRDAAGTLAQYDGTNPQTFRLYNTFTDASNHERGFMRWSSNVLQIGTEAGGTGTVRDIVIRAGTSDLVTLTASNGNMTMLAGSIITFSGRARIRDGGTGCVLLQQPFTTDFDRLMFGGSTNAFPALKRSSTTLQVRLANDSDFAPLSCGALTLNGNLDASTRDLVTDTTTGTKIGTATTQKIGFFNATPVVQQAAIADATDAATTQARLNDLLAAMRSLGLIAT